MQAFRVKFQKNQNNANGSYLNSNNQVSLQYNLSDQETLLLFNIDYCDNRITRIGHSLLDQIREIQIVTDCIPEQPMIPYPDINKSPETLDLQLAQIMAIETHYHCKVPEYARLVRLLLMEMHRLLNHFNFFSSLAHTIQFPKLFDISVANSTIVNKLLSTLNKVQSLDKYFIIGGIATDLQTGFFETLIGSMHVILNSLNYFEKQLVRKTLLSNLLEDIGIIDQKDAKSYSLSGPNYYASLPQAEYDLIANNLLPISFSQEPIRTDFHKGTIGDSWNRTWIRFLEIEQSLRFITRLSNVIMKTDIVLMIQPFLSGRDFDFTVNFIQAEGRIISHINKNQNYHYITGKHQYPVINAIKNLDSILVGERISSAKIIISSLNLNPVKYHIY